MTYLFEKRRAGQKPGCSLQEPSPLPPRAKPRPENALDQKLSCSLQDFGFGPADPCGPGSYGCAQRPRDGNRGRPWCSWDARRAISSGCPELPVGRRGRNESSRGGSRLGDGSGNPPDCTQPDRGGTWKVENCTRNSGSNEVAIGLLRGLERPRGTSNNKSTRFRNSCRVLTGVLAQLYVEAAASNGGGVVPYWLLDSSKSWFHWLRLASPKLAPFLAGPNRNEATRVKPHLAAGCKDGASKDVSVLSLIIHPRGPAEKLLPTGAHLLRLSGSGSRRLLVTTRRCGHFPDL